jgi:hypothetical protein
VSIFGLILIRVGSTVDAIKPLKNLGFEGAFVWGFAPLPLSSTQSPTYLPPPAYPPTLKLLQDKLRKVGMTQKKKFTKFLKNKISVNSTNIAIFGEIFARYSIINE